MKTVPELEAVGTLTFHQALIQAEAQARSTLDFSLHERLSCAVSLVKDGRVFQTSDGTWQVDSSSTQGLTYSVNGTCNCDDHHFNKPRWCKHQLAMLLSQRVLTLMHQPSTAPVVPEMIEPWADNDLEPPPPPVEPAPAQKPGQRAQVSGHPALPEAPASANCHLTIAGRQVQLTLRDTDEVRLLERLQAVLQQYPAPEPAKASSQGPGQTQPLSPQQHNAAAMHRPVTGFCAVHNVQMHLNTGKDGRTWYSHRLPEGGFCKGR